MLTVKKLRQTMQVKPTFTFTDTRLFRSNPHIVTGLPHISSSNDKRITILISKHMFWGSGNLIRLILKRYLHSIVNDSHIITEFNAYYASRT